MVDKDLLEYLVKMAKKVKLVNLVQMVNLE